VLIPKAPLNGRWGYKRTEGGGSAIVGSLAQCVGERVAGVAPRREKAGGG